MKISTPLVIEIKTQDLIPYTTNLFQYLMWMKHGPTNIFDTKVPSISTYSFVFLSSKVAPHTPLRNTVMQVLQNFLQNSYFSSHST
jgi:hypothetical protein